MNRLSLDQQPPWVHSMVEGAERGAVASLFCHPLEVCKINYQGTKNCSYATVLNQLWKEGGVPRFYRGFSSQVTKCVMQQLWRWPLMTEIPVALSQREVEGTPKQIITGGVVGVVDSGLSFGLDKIKIIAASTNKTGVLRQVVQEGSKGMSTYMKKSTCGWVTFLSAQDYLRRQARTSSDAPLTFSQKIVISIEVAAIVYGTSAPLDYATTQTFTTGQCTSVTKGICQAYRKSPLYFVNLLTQNILSIFLLERLEQKRKTRLA